MPRPSRARRREDTALASVRIGAVTVTPLVQFHYRVDPLLFFPGLDLDALDPGAWYLRPPYRDDGFLVVDVSAFLIRTPDRTLLVDAAVGNGKHRPNPCFHDRNDDWPTLLDRAGVAPEDVDTVVFTHLHVDHVGFATRYDGARWTPTFPRARYLTTAAELEYWTGQRAQAELARLGDYLADSVLPLRAEGMLDVVPPDQRICPQVRLRPAPGHTPGNVCVEINSRGRRAVFAGDIVHHAIQLARPALSTDFCVHDAQATVSREALLRDIADRDVVLFPTHFPDATPGRIVTGPAGGYRYEPVAEQP